MSVMPGTKVCVKCQIELRVKTNGVLLVEMAAYGPVSVRDADLWACPECGFELVAGMAARPHLEHFQGDVAAFVRSREKLYGQRVIHEWLNPRERDDFKARSRAAEAKKAVGL